MLFHLRQHINIINYFYLHFLLFKHKGDGHYQSRFYEEKRCLLFHFNKFTCERDLEVVIGCCGAFVQIHPRKTSDAV